MSKTKNNNSVVVIVEPILVGVSDAAKLLGISRGLFYEMISDGRFGLMGTRFGRKRLFSVDEIRRWIFADCPCREKWMKIRREDKR